MIRQRPLTLLAMGVSSCVFAAIWFLWLLSIHGGDLIAVLGGALGKSESLAELEHRNLASAGPIRVLVTLFAVQTALIGLLAWTGMALVRFRPAARWWAIGSSLFVIAVALCSTCLHLAFLTLPGEPVRVTPFFMDASAILFANLLCGTMFLPEVTVAYAGDVEL